MSDSSPEKLKELYAEFGWAIEIVRKQFSTGLGEICDEGFLGDRYREFLRKDDPVYAELLKE